MNRNVLVVGGLVVAAAAIALVVMARRSVDAPAPAPKATIGSAAPVASASSPSAPTVTPSLPGSTDRREPAGSALEYEVGGMKVRDHRGGDQQPMQIPPNVHPPEARELPSTLTHDITQKVKQVMMSCAADLPRDARGAAPRLQGQIMVGIKGGTLTITKATMLLTDVTGDAGEATRSCIEQKSVGLATPATDEADMDSYSINLTFALP